VGPQGLPHTAKEWTEITPEDLKVHRPSLQQLSAAAVLRLSPIGWAQLIPQTLPFFVKQGRSSSLPYLFLCLLYTLNTCHYSSTHTLPLLPWVNFLNSIIVVHQLKYLRVRVIEIHLPEIKDIVLQPVVTDSLQSYSSDGAGATAAPLPWPHPPEESNTGDGFKGPVNSEQHFIRRSTVISLPNLS
jgi:hypothetical protein